MLVRIGNVLFHHRNWLFPCVYLLLFIEHPRIVPENFWIGIVGFSVALIAQFIRGLTVGLDYIVRGGKNRRVYAKGLVTGGLFSHCRNPLYVGNLGILLGLGLASNSLVFLTAGMAFFIFAYIAIVAAEENYLRGKFGAEYDEYCADVNRWLPRLSGLRETVRSMEYNWRRLISAEYGSAFVWMVAIVAVALQNLHADQHPASDPLVRLLWGALGAVVLGWALARFLKKSGRLETPSA
jgi:protein-S-isoprenylcysteine O-methyltransferase Ste14